MKPKGRGELCTLSAEGARKEVGAASHGDIVRVRGAFIDRRVLCCWSPNGVGMPLSSRRLPVITRSLLE